MWGVCQTTQGNCATEGNSGNCQSGNCHSGERWMRKLSVHSGQNENQMKGIDNIANGSCQQHVLLYVIKWQMIRFQALWKTKSFVKVCLKFKLPLWTKGLLIHLSPPWQLPLWHFPRWHNFPVYVHIWPHQTVLLHVYLYKLRCDLSSRVRVSHNLTVGGL